MTLELTTAEKYKQLNTAGVAELLGVSKRTVWRYVEQGVLPQPQYIKPKHPRWRMGEVITSYESNLVNSSDVVQVMEATKTTEMKTSSEAQVLSTAAKLKKRFGLS